MTRIATVTAAAIVALATACSSGGNGNDGGGGTGGGGGGTAGTSGGGSGGGAPLGLDRNKSISTVTEDEKGLLCDWYAPMAGGYGAPRTCTMGFISAPPDKASCIASFPSCAVTIGQFQDCLAAMLAAQMICTQTAIQAAQTRPDCIAVGLGNCF
jgi:hypothetical protein